MKKNIFKIVFLMLMMIGIVQFAIAQSSYIYIEAIKSMPISVNINGNEIKSLAKNYLLFETKQEGENNIEIKFAGNLYPSQKFVLNVVPNAQYGYKLAKANEEKFYLLDLVNNGKIIELNTSVNFAFSTEENNIHFYNPNNYVLEEIKTKGNKLSKKKSSKLDENLPTIAEIEKKEKYGIVEVINSNTENIDTIKAEKISKKKKKEKKIVVEETEPAIVLAEPVKEVVEEPKEVVKKKKEKKKKEIVEEKQPLIEEQKDIVKPVIVVKEEPKPVVAKAVSKCIREASDYEVNSFVEKLATKSDDEAKLILLKKKFFTGCISTKHLYSVVEKFDTQYGRFTVVKFIKPEIIDSENLGTLQPLFKYETYKQKLKKLAEE